MLLAVAVKLPCIVRVYPFKSRMCLLLVPLIVMFPNTTFEPSKHLSVGLVANEMFDPLMGTHPSCQFDAVLKAVLVFPTQVYVLFTDINAELELSDIQLPLVITAL